MKRKTNKKTYRGRFTTDPLPAIGFKNEPKKEITPCKTSSRSIYTSTQWEWVAERFMEGYFIGDLASFLGLSHVTVRRYLQQMGVLAKERDSLIPLTDRKKEFLSLG